MKHLYLRNLSNAELEEFSKGDTLLKEGEICKYIYFIERGQLRTFYNKNGRNININFSFENHFVTNLKSFLYSSPSEYYIQVGEKTAIRRFDKEQLSCLFRDAGEAESFSQLLLRLLVRQEEHGNLFKIYTPSERYHYVAKYYPMLLQRVSLSHLSSYLGISRETISRIRRNTPTFSGI